MKHFKATNIPTLDYALSELMTCDDLKKLAALTKEKLPTRKADLAAVIKRHLEGDRLQKTWQDLDEWQRAAVAEVVHASSNTFDTDHFQAKYGQSPNWGVSKQYGLYLKPSALHFFFYGQHVMPADLKARLKTFVPKPADPKAESLVELPTNYNLPITYWDEETRKRLPTTKSVPLIIHESQQKAQQELLSILYLIESGKVSVSQKTRRASSATIKAITNVLKDGDFYPLLPVDDASLYENAGPIRAFAWPILLQAGGLAQLSGSKLQLTRAGRKALSDSTTKTLRTLWSKWLDSTLFDELCRVECIKGQTGKGKHGLTALAWRRAMITETLLECPPGVWIATDEFLRFLHASGNQFSVSDQPWNLYVDEPRFGSLGYDGQGESIAAERYLFAFLLEYAATLGVIDVALIPPAGARQNQDSLWGTDNLAYFSRYDGLMYLRITPLGAYCLGTESICEPAPVEYKPVLRKIWDRGVVRLVECADDAQTTFLANDTRTGKLCMRAGERHLLVPLASEAAFKQSLDEIGVQLSPSGDPSSNH